MKYPLFLITVFLIFISQYAVAEGVNEGKSCENPYLYGSENNYSFSEEQSELFIEFIASGSRSEFGVSSISGYSFPTIDQIYLYPKANCNMTQVDYFTNLDSHRRIYNPANSVQTFLPCFYWGQASGDPRQLL